MTSGGRDNLGDCREDVQEPPSDSGSFRLRGSRATMAKSSCSCTTGRSRRFKPIGRCAKVVKASTPTLVRLSVFLVVAHSIEKPNTAMPFPWCRALLALLVLVEAYSAFWRGNFDEPVGKAGRRPNPRACLGMSRWASVLRTSITIAAAAAELATSLAASIVSIALGCCRCRISDLKVREGWTLYRRGRACCALSSLQDSNGGVGGNADSARSTASWKTMTNAAASRAGVACGVGTGRRGLETSGLRRFLCTAFAVASVGVAYGHGDNDQRGRIITIPLSRKGFQYAINVSVSNASYEADAALIVDTGLHIVGFPFCSGDSEDEGYEDMGCIPSKYADPAGNSSYSCQQLDRDDGTVKLYSDFFKDPSTSLRYLSDQRVELLNSTLEVDTSSSATLSTHGSVFLIFSQASESDSTLQGWSSARGVLGLAPYVHPNCNLLSSDELYSSVFSLILEENEDLEPMFALNLNDNGSESTLEIGGHNASSNAGWGELLWGERHTASKPYSWGFSAFGLSVCGRNLMDNVTSSWPAVLYTGSACLGLPQEMFDGLVSWLPCRVVGDSGTKHKCYINQDTASSDLPYFSFRLSEHGMPLYIPLGSLLLNEGPSDDPDSTERRLCVTRGVSIFDDDRCFNLPTSQPVITLGTLVLRSMYAVMDTDVNRVGLSQKPLNVLPQDHNETCRAPMACLGMQTYKESTNSCEDPICSTYFFARLDEDTMTCRSPVSLSRLAWTVGIIIAVTEMGVHFLRAYYGGTGVALRRQRRPHDWEFHVGRIIDAGVGKAVRALGLSPPSRDD